MISYNCGNWQEGIRKAGTALSQFARKVETARWQGMEIKGQPGMATYELLNFSVEAPCTESLDQMRSETKPNLPWADDHFLERVGGHPLNPGVQWANWPYAKSANRFRTERGKSGQDPDQAQFSHSYMERMWPRFAGLTPGGVLPDDADLERGGHYGIRCRYGDLQDVVKQLAREPDTRQAYLPLWFPEDTGVIHGGRVPCTLGYQFIWRHGYLHTVYHLRSCDYVRHFRDDIYLALRLKLWVLDQCRGLNTVFRSTIPGTLTLHITSFHVFENDYRRLLTGAFSA